MFLDWKNQHGENDYTVQSDLQVQCDLYQNPIVIFYRNRKINSKVGTTKDSE